MLVQYWRWLTNLFNFHPEELQRGNLSGFFTPSLGTTFSGEDVQVLSSNLRVARLTLGALYSV